MKRLIFWAFFATAGILSFAQSAPGPIPTTLNPCTSTCTPAVPFSCTQNTITNFNDKQYVAGTGTGQNSVGAIWYYYNVATDNAMPTSPVQVNASIKIDAIYQATLVDFDNDSAVNQNGTYLPNLFAPTISADQTLGNSSRKGYVQFTISFFKNTLTGATNKFNVANYTTPISLSILNYIHYDIDGTSGTGYELRENGLVKQVTATNPSINVNSISELNGYNYTGDGSTWRGFVGSTCNRGNTSNCAEVVASMTFNGAYQAVTVRMGYDYKWISGTGLNSQPGRLYASTFGCFIFPVQGQLPLTLLNFSGICKNNASLLNWQTSNESGFDHFEIQRSTDGINFSPIGEKATAAAPGANARYQYSDNLSSFVDNAFFYRLKMIDKDGRYSYSNTLLIRKEQNNISGISISPNPVTVGDAFTARFYCPKNEQAMLKIIDLSGKTVYTRQNSITAGNNSIVVKIPENLQPGMYFLQLSGVTVSSTAKLSVVH